MAAIRSIQTPQLVKLPLQTAKCPTEIGSIEQIDKKTWLTSDEYLGAPWSAKEKHYMMHLLVLINQCETKTVRLPKGGEKLLTNKW